MLFKNFWMSLDANQTKHGQKKGMNFTIDQWNHGYKIMHSTQNEGKSVVAERFIRTLKNTIYKFMTSI